MKGMRVRLPGPAMVVAMLALLVALSGTAVAAGIVPKTKVAATNENDQGSGVQAWAQVNPNGGSPLLVRSKNFVSVSSPSTGVYCLHSAAGVNLANSAPVATQEVNLSSTLGLVTVRRSGIPNTNCLVNDLQVNTWDASNPSSFSLVNTVAFDVIVP